MPKSATAVDPMVKPDANLEKRIRRVFKGDYKLSIIQQAGDGDRNSCSPSGDLNGNSAFERFRCGGTFQWYFR